MKNEDLRKELEDRNKTITRLNSEINRLKDTLEYYDISYKCDQAHHLLNDIFRNISEDDLRHINEKFTYRQPPLHAQPSFGTVTNRMSDYLVFIKDYLGGKCEE